MSEGCSFDGEYLNYPPAVPSGHIDGHDQIIDTTESGGLTLDPVNSHRSRWMEHRTALLLSCLQTYSQSIPEHVAQQLISDRLGRVAQLMRRGRQAAKYHITDDVIAWMARAIADALAHDDANPIALQPARTSGRLPG
jgi:hypothetical protein